MADPRARAREAPRRAAVSTTSALPLAMGYTLAQLSADARAAMDKDSGPAGRDVLRQCIERACADDGFVTEVFAGHTEDRRVRTRSKKVPVLLPLFNHPNIDFWLGAGHLRG